jgi:hypothetical protein
LDATTYATLENSLIHMRDVCEQMELRTISISQESLELDDLEWPVIKELINKIFKNLNIEIRVYRNLDQIKFEQILKILKYSEQQMNTCFS